MQRTDAYRHHQVCCPAKPDAPNPDISPSEFRISITLDLPPDTEATEPPGTAPPTMVLSVRYPDAYPDEAPHLELLAGGDGGGETHPFFSVADDRASLLAQLEDTVQENLGMAMVFTLVSALKDAAEQLVVSRRAEAAKKREEALLEAERLENEKFHGTPVTRETFLKWREEFLKEMEEARAREEEARLAELKKAKGPKELPRLTGRQLWEKGLAGKVDEEDDEGVADAEEGVEKLKV